MLLQLKYSGLLNQKSIEKLAKKENVKPHTLWQDWSRRHLWLKEMAQIEQTRNMVLEILHEFKSAREEGWKTYTEARTEGHYTAAVSALHMITKGLIAEMSFRQSLGVMEKAPIEIKVEQTRNIRKAVIFFIDIVEKENPALLPELLKIVKDTEDLEKADKKFLEKGR